MLVNVFMPVYNTKPKLIEECLESITNQTFADWKVIIIDDVSTDEDTRQYLDSLCPTRRCEVHRLNKNVGEMFARLEGRHYLDADCKYVAFMDSDDLMMPDRFEKQVAFLNDNPSVGILGAQLQKFYSAAGNWSKVQGIVAHCSVTDHPFDVNQFIVQKHWTINNPSTMMRREVVENFDPQIIATIQDSTKIPRNTFGDYIFYTLNHLKGVQIRNLSDVLLLYRVQVSQLTQGESYNEENHKRLRMKIWRDHVCKR